MKNKLILLFILTLTLSSSVLAQMTGTAKPAGAKGILEIESALELNGGETEAVEGGTFYLLKADPETLIRTLKLYETLKATVPSAGQAYPTYEQWTFKIALHLFGNDRYAAISAAQQKAIMENAAATVTTGADGKGSFGPVQPGEYFIFGKYKWGTSSFDTTAWKRPVLIKAGTNKMILDGNNAQH